MDNIIELIGARLKDERRRLGLNQEDFGAIGGVKKPSQIAYEQGKRSPDAAYLVAVSAIGVDIFYVLTGEISSAMLTSEENALVIGYRNLDIRGKAGVLGMIGGMSAPKESPKAIFHGDVGQTVKGDINAPFTIKMPSKKK